MANDLTFNQVSTLLNAINSQATGQTSLAPVNTYEFVTMAQTLLQTGYDPLATAISQVLARTIFSIRPYSEIFKGLRVSNQKYGNHVRKLQSVDKPLVDSSVYSLTDEQSVDHYEVRKPEVLQTNFYGEETYSDFLTIYTVQLDNAMSGPEEFASFISMIIQNVEDKLTMSRENLSRMLVANLIGAKMVADTDNVIDLLSEYNAYLGLDTPYTDETIRAPEVYSDFIKFCYAKIKSISDLMRSRSVKFHMNITDKPIMRHTPYDRQKLYISSFDKHMIDTRVIADVFNADQMRLIDFETVDYWQSIDNPTSINVVPEFIDASGEIVNGTNDDPTDPPHNIASDGIFGILFDEDAIGYTITLERTERTPLNARGMYYNQFWHDTKKYWTDLTENAVVFTIGSSSDSDEEDDSDLH